MFPQALPALGAAGTDNTLLGGLAAFGPIIFKNCVRWFRYKGQELRWCRIWFIDEGLQMFRLIKTTCVSIAAILSILALCGCSSSSMTYALFTEPELGELERYAVFGVDGEKEQVFMAEFIDAFPDRDITFVERQRIAGITTEQDFLPGRLNSASRAKLQQIYGVQAAVLCEYTIEGDGVSSGVKKLRVRILDTETAVIVGSVVVNRTSSRSINDLSDFIWAVQHAVEALKENLEGVRYSPYPPATRTSRAVSSRNRW